MIVFPNCKINLGLHIIGKRVDDFHDIETVFYPILLRDTLEIIQADQKENAADYFFTTSGLVVNGNAEDNLCIKAYQLLKKDFPYIPSIAMHLHKAISMGAGLGGGSADGTFTLLLLNQKFKLNLSEEQLLDYASKLGSDCPFFIINKPCYATGRGEILEPLALDLSAFTFVIVDPKVHISTDWAFSQAILTKAQMTIKELILQPVETWRAHLKNDFEQPAFNKYPELKEVKERLYKDGAVYAAMTGSGSAIFGLFTTKQPSLSSFPPNYGLTIL